MTDPFAPLDLARGPAMPNRFMLAPLTNQQSHADGTLSDEEYHWLTLRAEGGFGLVMTCAAHVQRQGQGFPGQLGIWSDDHLPGLTRLANGIRQAGGVSSVQLHHAGLRSPEALIGEAPQGPFAEPDNGRVLTTSEIARLRDDFIVAAVRAERAGFDGVEIHGAHGYVLCQFLDPVNNTRTDGYGGSYEERTRIFHEVIDGIRAATGPDFQLGLRLSAERFNVDFGEAKRLAEELMLGGKLDFLDMSLWDCFMEPSDPAHAGQSLIAHFAGLQRGAARLGVAGKIMDMGKVRACLAAGVDFVLLGRAAILKHDFPKQGRANPNYGPTPIPVTRDHLRAEGLSEGFIDYFATFPGYVSG